MTQGEGERIPPATRSPDHDRYRMVEPDCSTTIHLISSFVFFLSAIQREKVHRRLKRGKAKKGVRPLSRFSARKKNALRERAQTVNSR